MEGGCSHGWLPHVAQIPKSDKDAKYPGICSENASMPREALRCVTLRL